MKRRQFIQSASLTGLGVVAGAAVLGCKEDPNKEHVSEESKELIALTKPVKPLVIATWNVPESTAKAWEVIAEGNTALDAIEKGCMVEEANAEGQSVGIGGLPDRDGNVTLDACIMNKEGDYGAVLYMQNIVHPISVARKVMENTPHVILAGKGAEQFAVSEGFKRENLLTDASKKAW